MKATAPRRAAGPAPALCVQALLHRAQEQAQGSALQIGVVLQELTQALRHRQHPLPQRQVREDVIGEMRRRLEGSCCKVQLRLVQ